MSLSCANFSYTKEFNLANKHSELEECDVNIKNIGWSLGNTCPYKCKQCYSLGFREQGENITHEMVDIKENLGTVWKFVKFTNF